ncbi:MAG TPA: adenylate/guanylate cyclase domain-containing protein, partial [Actinomycetota bacterium]|nr:adenylate/guanylate cyclase domain-containing protein [Actinomycetota bacterium]
MSCPSCGAAVPEQARFCPSCGSATTIRSDERRIVSVVFADIVGFTALSETRDPEEVKRLVDRCFERLASDVTAHGGRVDKIVGDGMLALFGAPISHEDDPERAVRTALAMQQTALSLVGETGVDVKLRVGVNTGEVLVGGLRAGGDYTAMGDVVNTASRLQTIAEPGTVLVGADTYEATRDVIRYEELGQVVARGREQPVEVWRAIEPVTLPGRRPRRARAPLLGRDHELGMLRQSVAAAVHRARPLLVVLVGEAGLGKSRLVEEVTGGAAAEHGAVVYRGRCVPYGEANPFWPVGEALREAIGIGSEEAGPEVVEKVRHAVGEVMRAHVEASETVRLADGLLYLMGVRSTMRDVDPQRAREDAFRSLGTVLQRFASDRPVSIVLSELHWADPVVLELIDDLLSRVRGVPVIVVATARPEVRDRWTPAPGRHDLVLMNLEPLDQAATVELARTLLGGEVPHRLLDVLVERSGGNPLFVEELALLLAGEEPSGDLPVTLRGLVSARLDSLTPGLRDLLADAAVLGQSGPVEALSWLASQREADDPTPDLDLLVSDDLLAVSDGEFSFKSDLVREVAYAVLTRGERALRHARLAEWFASRGDDHPEQIAHHYSVAAATVRTLGPVAGVPDDVSERAIASLERAVVTAETREALASSVLLIERMLELVPPDDPRHLDLRARRAAIQATRRRLDDARAEAEAILTEASPGRDARAVARAKTVLGDVLHKERRQEAAVAALEDALAAWREAGDPEGEASALRLLGLSNLFRGRADEAEASFTRALDIARDLDDRRGIAWALQHLGWSAFMRGQAAPAEEWLTEAAAVFTEVGDWRGLAWVFGLLGWVRMYQGRLDEAESFGEMVLEESRDFGDRWGEAMMLVLLGSVHLWSGRTASSVEMAQRALQRFREIGDPWGAVQAGLLAVRALAIAGRVDEARDRLAEARQTAETANDPAMKQLTRMTSAAFALQLGEPDEVPHDFRASMAYELGRERELEVEASIGLALLQSGRTDEAIELLRSASEESNDPGIVTRTWSLLALALAAGGRSDEAIAAARRVHDVDGGTYLDRSTALMASAMARASSGDAAAALEDLRAADEL